MADQKLLSDDDIFGSARGGAVPGADQSLLSDDDVFGAPGLTDRLKNAPAAFAQGITGVVAAVPKQASIMSAQIARERLKAIDEPYTPPTSEGEVHPVTGRPILKNADGSIATEESITVTNPRLNGGRPTNIPSIWNGQRPPHQPGTPEFEDWAVESAIRSGQQYPAFNSIDEAVAEAKARSEMLGQTEGRTAHEAAAARTRRSVVHPSDEVTAERRAFLEAEANQPIKERPAYRAGEAIEGFVKEAAPTDPRLQDEWLAQKIPHGLGSVAGFLATGVAGRVAGLPGSLPAAVAGAASQSVEQFEDAIKHNASLEDAFKAANLGALVGTSEALPIATLLERLDKGTGGSVKRIIVNAMVQGTEEALQEAFQNISGNLIANKIVAYDPQRGTFTGTGEAAGLGFTVGGLASTIGHLVLGRRGRHAQQPASDAVAPTDDTAGVPGGAVPADTILPSDQSEVPAETIPSGPPEEAVPFPGTSAIEQSFGEAGDAAAAIPTHGALQRALAKAGPVSSPGVSPDPAAAAPSQPSSPATDELLPPEGASAIEQAIQRSNAEVSTGGVGPVAAQPQDAVSLFSPSNEAGKMDTPGPSGLSPLDDLLRNPPSGDGSRTSPVQIQSAEDVARAAAAAATDYSPEQGEANNRVLGHAKWNGLPASIEVDTGGVRKGTNPKTGEPWQTTHSVPYGYWKGTKGADGMHVDVYFGPNIDDPSLPAYVLDELDPKTGKFRQHKTFAGFASPDAVAQAYLGTSTKTPDMIGGVTAMPVDEFKAWLGDEGKTTKRLTKAEPAPVDLKVNKPKPRKGKGPASLFEFIAMSGGIDPKDPLIGDVRAILGTPNKFIPGFGMLIRPSGKRLDRLREGVVEAGYLHDQGAEQGALTTSTINDLLLAMDRQARGDNVYSEHDREEVAEREGAALAEEQKAQIKDAIAEARETAQAEGWPHTEEQLREAANTALVNRTDPSDELFGIIERAAIEFENDVADAQSQGVEDAGEIERTGTGEAGATAAQDRQPAGPVDAEAAEGAVPRDGVDEVERERGERLEAEAAQEPAGEGQGRDGDEGVAAKPVSIKALRDYARSVVGDDVRSVHLIGSTAAKRQGNDIDLLYDLGDRAIMAGDGAAADMVEQIIERIPNTDLDSYDSFFKVGDRYFHLSSGAGRAIIENTSYAKEQEGKPSVLLAEAVPRPAPNETPQALQAALEEAFAREPDVARDVAAGLFSKEPRDYTPQQLARGIADISGPDGPMADLLAKAEQAIKNGTNPNAAISNFLDSVQSRLKTTSLQKFMRGEQPALPAPEAETVKGVPLPAEADDGPAWWREEYTRAGREELARKALIPQAVRISKMGWRHISQPVRDKLEATHKAGLEQAGAGPIVKDSGASDGLQNPVPAGDARAGAADVQQPVEDRPVGDARPGEVAGGAQDVRRPDSDRAEGQERLPEGAVREGGRGAGEGGDVRVPDGERTDEPGRPSERAPAANARVEGENFSISPGALDESRSFKTKAEDNVRAIELVRKIEAEGRPATREEQAQLARYVGWGGIKGAFPDADGNFGKGLEKVGARIKELLSDTEYQTARRSIQYAHYTAEDVVRAMWGAAERFGFKAGKVFEPGMGVGNFAGMMPPDVAANAQYVGLELDHTTARIAKLLYPKWGVRRDDFTKAPLPENTFDLVIGNPPFADVVIKSDPKYAKHGFYLHDYFFAKSLDAVRPGGVLMFISSAGTMNKKDPSAREYLADRADLIGAIRLPSNAFAKNAGTEVTTDIIILRKRLPDEKPGDRAWTDTVEVTMPNREGQKVTGLVNRYFVDHPDMVLGLPDFADKLYANRYSVKARPGADLKAELAKAIDTLPAGVMSEWKGPVESGDKDFGTVEKKEGTFYIGPKGELMQVAAGVGVPVAQRGKGVEGGRTAAEIERIRGLVPVRDALRAVYDADLNGDTENGDRARAKLNKEYDAFVAKHGPINKAEIQKRRPNVIQQESARNEAREEARYAGAEFNEGTFDPTRLIKEGATLSEIGRARAKAREDAKAAGRTFDEGTFDPDEMPDVIIDKRPNVDPFMDDPESYRLRAIERYDDSTNTGNKGPVFFENLITKDREPTINGLDDAVLYVLNQKGRLDLEEIAVLTGKSESEAIQELGDRIFKEPDTDGAWVTRDEYLSGNVLKKLAIAKAAAERNPQFRRNVTALEAAKPMPLAPSQIHATMGMPWIPQDMVEQFATEHMGLDAIKVRYVPALAQWIVSGDTGSAAAVTTWGTDRRAAPALMSDVLNRQQSKIFDTIRTPDGTTTQLNVPATQAAQDKANAIKEAFDGWIYSDEKRADTLANLYNEKYNNLVVRDFDGSYLTTPGISKHWSWRPHQTRVVARIIQQGNTYMAHAVGAGKTSAMIGAGMEMRRLGLVRKPMYAVPNHMLGQFTKEFYEQYPTAKIAVADERQFHTDRRKQFIANVAVEDLDAIIITHSALGLTPISDEFQDGVIRKEVESYRDLLEQIPKDQENRITRSRIEKQIERLEQRLTGKANRRRDQVFTFEQMGVDFLFVDEAHQFRKLDFTTKMSNLKGITPEGSGAAWDLYVKTLYLNTINPGRSLVMASGTPVTNTMAELFTLSRFMQMQELEERGLSKFDAWAGAFGEPVTELEQDAAGGYKPVTRFAKFVNIAELSTMVRQVMDIVTSRQLEQYVTRPKLKGGKRIMNLAEKTPALERFQRSLAARMEKIAQRKGPPSKGDDILLSVINDGRHAAIDLRLAGIEPDGKSKLDLMIDNVFRIWKDTKRQPFHKPKGGGDGYEAKPFDHGPATQMIFANLGLSGARGFSVPDYIRSELARRGVPKDQIAYIYNYKSHVAKQKLFNDMNDGKVRILIGSTAKMATGVNAQRRLYAIHNQDPLWYPADDEQRNGRGIRQGNTNPEIEIHDYSTKGTYDSTMWGLMEKKARFIQGFFEGDPSMRDMEDLGEASQYAQAKALTTNDPRLIKLTEVKQDLQKALRRKSAFDQEAYGLKSRRASAESEAAYYSKRIRDTEQDIARRQDIAGDKFTASVGKTKFDKRVEFGNTVMERFDEIAKETPLNRSARKVGEIGGFALYGTPRKWTDHVLVDAHIERSGKFETDVEVGHSAVGLVRSAEVALQRFEKDLEEYRARTATAEKFLKESASAVGKKFEGDAEIADLDRQVRELEAELARPTTPVDKAMDTELIRISGFDDAAQFGSTGNVTPLRAERGAPFERKRAAGDTPMFALGDRAALKASNLDLYTPFTGRFREHADAIYPIIRAEMDRLGLKSVGLKLADVIEVWQHGQLATADGVFYQQAITLALNRGNKFNILNHEALHALRKLGVFTDGEWSILTRASQNTWRKQFNIERHYGKAPEWVQVEEGIAHAYADWADGKIKVDGRIARLFKRIRDFFEALGNALRGQGFKTAESIFGDIKSGRIGARGESGKKLSSENATYAIRSGDGDLFKTEIVDTADGPREQSVIPGAEKIGDRQKAERQAQQPKRSSKTQKTVDGLPLFDGEADPELPLFALAQEPRTAADRQRVMQGFLARGQFLDRAIRMPFDIFGGVTRDGAWKPGAKLFQGAANIITGAKFSVEGRFAGLNPYLEAARVGLVDRYGLDPAYVERERGRALDERAVMLQGAEVLKSLKAHKVGTAEARVLQAILTGEDVTDADMGALAEPIRAAVDQLGQEAVSLGMLSGESFERNRGAYLHRVYQKYEAEQNGLVRMVNGIMGSRRKKIIGDQFRGRGMFQEIALGRLMRDIPEWHEAGRGRPQKGDKFIRLDDMPEQGRLELRDDAGAEKPLRTVYWPADRAIPERYSGFRNQGTFEVRGEKAGKIVIWRDFTKAEREKMGEILDARYTIGKTFMLMAHDLSVGKLYKDIAENEEWASSQPPAGRTLDAAEWSAQRQRYWKHGDVEWVKVPNVEIPNSGGKKRWGALADRYVREEIWRDLNEQQIMSRPNVWRTLLTQWKLNKTARSPVVHMNNVMSNFVLMDLLDVRWQDLAQGLRSYVSGDAHYEEAFKHGAFGADMMTQEVRDQVLKPVLEELMRSNTFQQGGHLGALGQVSRFTELLWSKAKALDKKMTDLYRVEDELFRMATYIRRRALGDTPKQAADHAREQFIDYDIRAPWVNVARNTVLPFISYTYRAAPLVARAIATRPWKLGKYFLLAYAANAMAYALTGGDEDKERRSLREQEQGHTWLGTERMLRMPFNDQYSNPIFLDIRRWIPAGDVFDLSNGDIPAWLNIGGPLMIGAELFLNRQSFTGQEIFNTKTDDFWDRMGKRGDHTYKSFMPSAAWVPGSWYWEKVENAIKGATDRQGRPYSVPLALSSSIGIKLKPHDVDDAFAFKEMEFRRIERELQTEARRLSSRHDRKMISESEFNKAMQRIIDKKTRNAEKAAETFKDSGTLAQP